VNGTKEVAGVVQHGRARMVFKVRDRHGSKLYGGPERSDASFRSFPRLRSEVSFRSELRCELTLQTICRTALCLFLYIVGVKKCIT
jgi:hypothetical protein